MQIIKTVETFLNWRKNQINTIGFIPTLGALHDGHFSLVKKSTKKCNLTVVSIFLNPTQFSANEDLAKYPNTIEQDIKLLKTLNVDVLFLPNENEMYQKTNDVNVPETSLFKKLEGQSRPHFFYGVTTIVAKLFNIIQPSYTFFGEKDAQQLCIIQQMITNMKYSIVLISCPTIRNKYGLALSSRNQYLSEQQQKQAAIIYKGLIQLKKEIELGEINSSILKKSYTKLILTVPNMYLDYISIASINTLDEIQTIESGTILISTAVFFHNVRLIDNVIYSSET